MSVPAAIIFAPLMVSAQAAETPLEPTASWVVDYADNMCVAQREYGNDSSRLTFAIRPRPMSDEFDVYVFSKGSKIERKTVPATIKFSSGDQLTGKYISVFYSPKVSDRVSRLVLDRAAVDRMASGELVSISPTAGPGSFHLPQLGDALKVLDDCVADLLATWGFSREQQQAMSRPAEAIVPFMNVLSPDDYPYAALRNEEKGSNSVRFRIDVKGRVADCRIVESSGSKALDSKLCEVVHRMRFRPALDHEGHPMESMGFERAVWDVF